MTRARTAGFGLLAILTAGALAACGGTTSTASSPPATEADAAPAAEPAAATAGETFGMMLGAPNEFTLQGAALTAKHGKVTFSVTNAGKEEHEMVVLALASPSLDAIKAADGSAKEDTAVGEVEAIDPGVTKSVTLDLAPGAYALICNEPGHFAGGMHQILTVS